MPVAEKSITRLKNSFKDDLMRTIGSILELIEARTEIEISYIETAKKACVGLEEIAEIKRDTSARINFKNFIKVLNSKNLESKTREMVAFLNFLRNY